MSELTWTRYRERPIIESYPWLFRVSRALKRHRVRGETRLLELSRSLGQLDVVVHHRFQKGLARDVDFWYPLYLYPDDYDDPAAYEGLMLEQVSRIINGFARDTILVDCGADIGLVSAMLVGSSLWIKRLIAIEPNPVAFEVLVRNTSVLPLASTQQLQAGVSNFLGKGRLVSPPHDSSSHARYVESTQDSDGFDVLTIDSLDINPDKVCALKIDVEGDELTVIEGAIKTLQRASEFVIVFEAHFDQVTRTGVDPMAVVQLCQAARSCKVFVSEAPEIKLDLEQPFFDQMPDRKVYNIICST